MFGSRFAIATTVIVLAGCSVVIDTGDLSFDATTSTANGGASTTGVDGGGGHGGSVTSAQPESSSSGEGGCAEGLFYRDSDVDTFGDPMESRCGPAEGFVANDQDCDDTSEAVNPNGAETCNGIDDNCMAGIDEGTTCPEGCTAKVFDGHLYFLCNKLVEWTTAESTCTGNSMHLVRVDSPGENAFVQTAGLASPWCPNETGRIWIGGRDEVENTWKWTDNETFYVDGGSGCVSGQYCNWAANEPSNTAGNENCALMLTTTGQWNDQLCTNKVCFACEAM